MPSRLNGGRKKLKAACHGPALAAEYERSKQRLAEVDRRTHGLLAALAEFSEALPQLLEVPPDICERRARTQEEAEELERSLLLCPQIQI